MKYKLNKGQHISILIRASEYYSKIFLEINIGEKYDFRVDKIESWKDWVIRAGAKGYWNPFLMNKSKRIPNVNCFALCGTINQNEKNNFVIGESRSFECLISGEIYFFANDTKKPESWFQRNNSGELTLQIFRIN